MYTWQIHVGAIAILVSWTNMMFMVGQLPALDAYVAMYMTVQAQFAKLFAAFFCLLIGFTFNFCVVYGDSSAFANPLIGNKYLFKPKELYCNKFQFLRLHNGFSHDEW